MYIVNIEGRRCDPWIYTSVEVKREKVERLTYLLTLFGFTWNYDPD